MNNTNKKKNEEIISFASLVRKKLQIFEMGEFNISLYFTILKLCIK